MQSKPFQQLNQYIVRSGIRHITWSLRIWLAIQTPLRGRSTHKTAMLASEAGPTICQMRMTLMTMKMGTMMKTLVIWGKSCKRCASTDIRLTTSPTVVCLRAALDRRRLCKNQKMVKITLHSSNYMYQEMKYCHLFVDSHGDDTAQVHSGTVAIIKESLDEDIEGVCDDKHSKRDQDSFPCVLVTRWNEIQQHPYKRQQQEMIYRRSPCKRPWYIPATHLRSKGFANVSATVMSLYE